MIDQPILPGYEDSGTKRCWRCHEAMIPYGAGFCEGCWDSIPEPVQLIYVASFLLPEEWHDAIRIAVAQQAQTQLAKARIRPAVQRKLTSLSLDDLDL